MIGAGWVGLITATMFARTGHPVLVADINEQRIAQLRSGQISIHEDGMEEAFAEAHPMMRFTTSVSDLLNQVEVAIVCVNTDQGITGDADLSALEATIAAIPDHRTSRLLFVVKSTVPAGTGERMRAVLDRRGVQNVGYLSNPEFLREGCAIHDFLNADKVLIGAFDADDADQLGNLYARFGRPLVKTDVTSAELIKQVQNSMLATKVSFALMAARLCEATGADVKDVMQAVGLDERIGPRFMDAGVGWGGSCFRKDISALISMAGSFGITLPILEGTLTENDLARRSIAFKLKQNLGSLDQTKIALLGLSFKPGTNDLRDAPALTIARLLLAEGALVRGWDPVSGAEAAAILPELEVCDDALAMLTDADAAVVCTDWSQLKAIDWEKARDRMANPLLIDGRNMFEPEQMRALGFIYEGIGRR